MRTALLVGREYHIARIVTIDNAVNAGQRSSKDNARVALSSGSKALISNKVPHYAGIVNLTTLEDLTPSRIRLNATLPQLEAWNDGCAQLFEIHPNAVTYDGRHVSGGQVTF